MVESNFFIMTGVDKLLDVVGDRNCSEVNLKSYKASMALPEAKADLLLWDDPGKG